MHQPGRTFARRPSGCVDHLGLGRRFERSLLPWLHGRNRCSGGEAGGARQARQRRGEDSAEGYVHPSSRVLPQTWEALLSPNDSSHIDQGMVAPLPMGYKRCSHRGRHLALSMHHQLQPQISTPFRFNPKAGVLPCLGILIWLSSRDQSPHSKAKQP